MMKHIALLLLSAALVYGQFSPDKVLRYEYEGQLLTGIPGTSREHSGLKIKCTVELQQNSDVVRMKFTKVSLKHLQEKIGNPLENQSDEIFVDTPAEDLQILTDQLEKPNQFQYREGLISGIEASDDEPHWSINIKRGVLNLLQANLEGRNRIEDDNSVDVNRARKHEQLQKDKLFRVIEEGIGGECESQYVINSWSSIPEYKNGKLSDSKRGYNVTKVINYDNCVTRSMSTTTGMRGFKCALCETQKLLKSSGVVRLDITSVQNEVVIDSVVAEGQHVFTPYSTDDGGIVTFIRQTLKLTSLEREAIQQHQLIPEPENKQSKGGLKYTFQKNSEEDKVTNVITDVTSSTTEVTYLLKLLFGSVLEDELTEATPDLFMQLVQRLKKCSLAELQHVMEVFEEAIVSFEDQELIIDEAVYDMEKMMKIQSRKFLRDALPLVDTKHSRLLIKIFIENRIIVGGPAVQILSSVALTPRPTQLFVNRTMELCKSKAVIEDNQLRTTCLLTLGSLVNTLCNGEDKYIKCQPWIREYHKQFLLAGIKNSEPKNVKQMHLKAIGNAGLPETFDDIKHLIGSTKTEVELRVNAVYALRRLTITQQTKIRTLLIPLFLDKTNAVELRIAAYYIIMETKPSFSVVQVISESLRKETSNQVGSFVFSHLTSLSNSTIPCHRDISMVAKQALRYSKPFRNGAQFSKHIVIGKMIDDLKLGAFLEINHVGQKTSPFPLSMNAKLSANVLGYQTNVVEAGLRMESLHYIIKRLIGTRGNSSPVRKLVDDLVPVHKRERDQNPQFLTYFKLFGSEIRFASLDKLIIDSIINKDFTLLQKLESQLKKLTEQLDLQKAFVLFDGTHQIASELGLPLALNITSAGVMTLNYVGRVAARPALSEIFRDRVPPKGLVIEGALTPRLAIKITGKMGVDAVVFKTGVAIDANLNINTPINGKLKVDLLHGIYDVKINTPSQDRKLVILQTKPYTFKEEGEMKPSNIGNPGNEVKKPIKGQLIKKKPHVNVISVGKESVGVEMEMKTRWIPVTGVPSAPRFPLSGPVDFNITTSSGVNRPDEYLITVEVSTVNVSSEFIKKSMRMNKFRQWITSSSSSSEENEPTGVETSWGLDGKSHEKQWAFVPAWLDKFIEKAEQDIIGNGKRNSHGKSLEHIKLSSSSEEESTESKLATRVLLTIVGNNVEERTDTQRKIVTELLINDNEEGFKTATMELLQYPVKAGGQPFKMCLQSEIVFPVPDFVIPDNLRKRQDGVFSRFARPSRYNKDVESFSDSGIDASTSRSSSESRESDRQNMKHLSLEEKLRIMTKQIRSKLNVQWGVSCQNDTKLEIQARFEQGTTQLLELRDKQNPVLIQCNADRTHGLRYSPACLQILKQENELRSMHAMITYDNLPVWMKLLYSKSALLLQKTIVGNLVIENVDQQNKEGKVFISGAIDKTHTKMDLAIKHQYKTLTWHDVQLPVHLEPFSTRYPLISQYKQRIFNNKFPSTCKVVNDQIKTFDDVTYKYNITTCPHILAKDCSSSGLYTVTARQSPVHLLKKEVTILTEGNAIELTPNSDVDSINVTLDGIPVEIRDNQQITIFSNGERLIETIFPHMDKIDALTKRPSQPISGSLDNKERHIEDIMQEELAKTTMPDLTTIETVPIVNTVTVQNSTDSTMDSFFKETTPVPEETREPGRRSGESASRERHDAEERKYWRDFKIRVDNMESVSATGFGRVAHVIRRMKDTVEVECVSVGLKVKFNQRYIKTQVSPWYHGLQCGLCGEYDGEKTNDLVAPERLIYRDSHLFGMSYRVPDANLCSLDSEVIKCLPKIQTVVIDDVIIDNVQSTCFSKTPVPLCECTPTERKQQLLEFSCQRKDDESRYLREKAATKHIITKVSKRKTDFVSIVDSHLKCVN